MSDIVTDPSAYADTACARSEEALAAALHARDPRREDAAQDAFRRLCTRRASRRAARDLRLSRRP